MCQCMCMCATKGGELAGGANIVTPDVTGAQRKPCWMAAAKPSNEKKWISAKYISTEKKM